MERLSTQAVSAPTSESDPLESLAPFEGGPASKAVPALNHLVKAVREAGTAAEQRELCGQINKLLSTMEPGEANARSLVGWLDEEAFHGLSDTGSVPCRAVAVEALLRMGYPHALELDPDDLEFFRAHQRSGLTTGIGVLTRLLAAVAALGFGAMSGVVLMSLFRTAEGDVLRPSIWPEIGALAGTLAATASGLVMAWAPKAPSLNLVARLVGPLAALSLGLWIGPEIFGQALLKADPFYAGLTAVMVFLTAAAVLPRRK